MIRNNGKVYVELKKERNEINYNLNRNQVMCEIEKRENELVYLLQECKKSLENAPEGRLCIHQDPKRVQYYYIMNEEGSSEKYLRKSERHLAYMLAQKDYDSKLEKMIEKELENIRIIKSQYHPENYEDILFKMHEKRQELIVHRLKNDEEYVKEWLEEKYEGLGFDPNDETEYYTNRGERVRSKSEIIIANTLSHLKIPYHYEAPLYLKESGHVVYPDFKCLNVRKRKEILWEHLGMIGAEEYADKNVKKLEKYMINGYYQGDNLITTMETKAVRLSTKTIERVIKKYLL